MKIKRGILIGTALYFTIFLLGVTMTIIATKMSNPSQSSSTIYWILTIVSTVLLSCLGALWYFNKNERNAMEGIKLGVTFVLVGFVFDLLFFIPLFLYGPGWETFIDYYTTPSYYITIALVVASTAFVGSLGQQSKEENDKIKGNNKVKKTKKRK